MARETRLSEGEVPRRRLDREVTPGRCGNLDYCSIGMQRVLVQVPLSQPFVCPECASPLRAPGRRSPGGRPWLLPALRVGVLLAAMGASLVIGYTAGRAQHSVTQAVEVAGKRASEGIDAAGAVLGLATPPVAPVAANPAGESVFVAERPYPLRLSPVDASKPAVHLTREARFGQVTIDCAVAQALRHPACQVTDIRGADPFSASAVQWLQSLSVHYAPSLRAGVPVSMDHRWRVVLEDFSGTPRASSPAP